MGLEKLLEESPEAYYWIGFIMADGCFSYERERFAVQISKKDEGHLKKLSKFLGIKYTSSKWHWEHKGVQKTSGCVKICSYDRVNIRKIVAKFDFKKAKTYHPPQKLHIKNNNLFTSLLIGYIDGDGCLDEQRLRICCHSSWAGLLNSWFERIFNLSGSKLLTKKMKISKCRIDKRGLANLETANMKLIWFLKTKAKNLCLPFLKRKWQRVKKREIVYEKTFKRDGEIGLALQR